jgi:hypothetical protein
MNPLFLAPFDPDKEPLVSNEISRSVSLTNMEWAVIAESLEAYASTFRANHSQVVTTYVTRGQLFEAQEEASRMNLLLQLLDKIHSKIL